LRERLVDFPFNSTGAGKRKKRGFGRSIASLISLLYPLLYHSRRTNLPHPAQQQHSATMSKTIHRQIGRFQSRSADDASVSMIMKEVEDMDLFLGKVRRPGTERSGEVRWGW